MEIDKWRQVEIETVNSEYSNNSKHSCVNMQNMGSNLRKSQYCVYSLEEADLPGLTLFCE